MPPALRKACAASSRHYSATRPSVFCAIWISSSAKNSKPSKTWLASRVKKMKRSRHASRHSKRGLPIRRQEAARPSNPPPGQRQALIYRRRSASGCRLPPRTPAAPDPACIFLFSGFLFSGACAAISAATAASPAPLEADAEFPFSLQGLRRGQYDGDRQSHQGGGAFAGRQGGRPGGT